MKATNIVNHMGLDKGSRIEFDVLMLGGDKSVQFGTPVVMAPKWLQKSLSQTRLTKMQSERGLLW